MKLVGVTGSLGDVEWEFEIKLDSARDADNNIIPGNIDSAAPYVGDFSNETNAQQLANWIHQHFGSSGGGTTIVCTMSQGEAGVTVTCSYQ